MIVLNMRNKINWLLCFTVILFATSCNNSTIEDINAPENELTNINNNESLTSQLHQIYSGPAVDARTSMFDSQESDMACFEFIYPISFILPDGSEITINDDEGWDEIDIWYEENKDSDEEPEIVYPFDVIFDDNEIKTINNEEDLEGLEEYCYGKDYEKDYDEECFEFVYPISFILPDGSEITINDDEGWDEIDIWYEENKDSDEEPEIVYPFDVIFDDNEIKTINNEEDLEGLEDYCG